ncbi:MAG: hypothetical protein COA84_13675 [Robiginitomaculum sp.]|nr:MAG: hypothetical protein COA84_13675 [Robiginitomaculum sp.]
MIHDNYYVIPDLHGMNGMLQQALTTIYDDNPKGGKIIFLGDYIDRGTECRAVVETVMHPPENWEFICLKGNHEEMFVDAANMRYPFYDHRVPMEWPEGIPLAVIRWMDALPYFHFEGNNVFAHAAYDGHRSPEDQILADCVWLRYSDSERFHSKDSMYLTHGHTPRRNGPIKAPNRINMDCAAAMGGRLVVGIYNRDHIGPVDFLEFGIDT